MATQEKQPPILVAAFPEEGQMEGALKDLMERKIGPDFIGAFVGESDYAGNSLRRLHLLAVLAPRRLHEDIAAVFRERGAEAVGEVAAMRARYGQVPHPGCLDYQEMKVPMGPEYWQFVASRKSRR
jgi:hypothetical protein